MAGGTEPVDHKWLNKTGAAVARTYSYVCATKGCNIPMFPIFPTKERINGKVPKNHFGTRGRAHIDHGKSNHIGDPPDTSNKVYPSSSPPTVWRDKKTKEGRQEGDEPSSKEHSDNERPGTARTNSSGVPGKKSISSLKNLVEYWLNGYPDILDKEFRMPGSQATTWGEIFRDVTSPTPVEEQDQRVWFSSIKHVKTYGHKAVLLHLDGYQSTIDFRIYLESDEPLKSKHPELFRLISIAGEETVFIYMLGCRSRSGKIHVESIDKVHVRVR